MDGDIKYSDKVMSSVRNMKLNDNFYGNDLLIGLCVYLKFNASNLTNSDFQFNEDLFIFDIRKKRQIHYSALLDILQTNNLIDDDKIINLNKLLMQKEDPKFKELGFHVNPIYSGIDNPIYDNLEVERIIIPLDDRYFSFSDRIFPLQVLRNINIYKTESVDVNIFKKFFYV
ncbi:MAG: hypothetical protein WC758_05775 [Candidatus Woesearchaeota archaeon]|jgi:hypothetical protein